MEKIRHFDEFINGEELTRLQDFFQKNVLWQFGWLSNRDRAPFGHWNHDFLNTHHGNQEDASLQLQEPDFAPLEQLWRRLKSKELVGHSLVRCYANAHTFGIEGYPHVDSRLPGNFTTIVYLNPTWKPEWAGETVFMNDEGDIHKSILPRPGRAVIFDGRITHAVRALTRICPAMRVTLMFKTTSAGSTHDSTSP